MANVVHIVVALGYNAPPSFRRKSVSLGLAPLINTGVVAVSLMAAYLTAQFDGRFGQLG